jgi:hypothetical protein
MKRSVAVVVKFEYHFLHAMSTVLENGFGHFLGDLSRFLAHSLVLLVFFGTIIDHGSSSIPDSWRF